MLTKEFATSEGNTLRNFARIILTTGGVRFSQPMRSLIRALNVWKTDHEV